MFVERAIAVLRSVFDDVVVAGESTVTPSVPVLSDRVPGCGPLSGLDAAYAAAEGRAVFVLALDMPFISPPTVRSLIDPRPDPTGATIARSDGRIQPLCGIYGSDLAERARSSITSSDRSMAAFLDGIGGVRYVEVDPRSTMNINSVVDLDAAMKVEE
ncbi:MAG: NTP transferase domain-containing protein [Proteobacteria bacterium]|nr:NTP transferase domain-containing protein [Pseudomonadota bacterium]